MFRGHQPAGQRGAQVHPKDCKPGVRGALHRRDVLQVDRLRPLQILLLGLDLSRLCYCLCKCSNSLDFYNMLSPNAVLY